MDSFFYDIANWKNCYWKIYLRLPPWWQWQGLPAVAVCKSEN